MKKTRRVVQILFFALFIVLLVQTEYKGEDVLAQPVRFFLEIDPLLTVASIIAVRGFILFAVGLAAALGLAYLAARAAGKVLDGKETGGAAALLLRRYLPLAVVAAFLAWGVFYEYGLGRGLPPAMTLGVTTVLVTLVLGRVFCGWLCPMGSLQQFAAWLKRDKQKTQIDKNGYQANQRWKYMVLLCLLAAALLGFQVAGLMDPISLLIRSFSVAVSPLVNQAVNGAHSLAYETGSEAVTGVADQLYRLVEFPRVLSFSQPHFAGAWLIGLIFAGILALNLVRPRYWCRSLCPLGALLGAVSRNSFYRLEIDKEKCIRCGRCHAHCQGACDPEHKEGWRPSECFVCFHCTDVCPVQCLSFRFGSAAEKKPGIDLRRRRALEAVAVGLVAVPLIRANEQYKREGYPHGSGVGRVHNPALVRPPGALPEAEFLQRCVRCGECMKVCPNNALHPAALEAGVEGLWTPILIAKLGYCEYNCTLCGQVCPTGAIRKLDMQEKHEAVIGTAFIDTSRCLPYAFGIDCIVCEEACPTSPKAIWLAEADRKVRSRDEAPPLGDPYGGGPVEQPYEDPYAAEQPREGGGQLNIDDLELEEQTGPVKQPRIDLEKCVGCGICEYKCVVADLPAIRVTAVEESRSTENRIRLQDTYSGF